ncbi:MAG: RluA family pseudouridine synthase [Saprospiraceae bacterium]|nr:RluA family pseudouridine synthase [Saprospiraceae bacterium]
MRRQKPTIVYQDEDILVMDKPAGMLSVPDRYDTSLTNVAELATRVVATARPLHRLDRGTSGLMAFGLHLDAFRNMSLQFEERTIDKEYLALCHGCPTKSEGEIDKPLMLLRAKNQVVVHPKGKSSLSQYSVVQKWQNHVLLSITPQTGRTHQIRVHLQSIGCPLIVDSLYGGLEAFYLSQIKSRYRSGSQKEERPLLSRTPLHAHRLQFDHPSTKKRIDLTAPLPKDMKAVRYQLDKIQAPTLRR